MTEITQQNLGFSIIIPAYNETDRLPKTMDQVLEWVKTVPYELEIIIVDDGSKDDTRDIARSFMAKDSRVRLVEETHVGQMNAILSGFKKARYPLVANMEADCATHPREYERLIPYLSNFDVVTGSRILRGDLPPIEGKSPFRRMISAGFSRLYQLFFKCDVVDPQVGFKIYRREVIEKVVPLLTSKHDGIKSAEILVKAAGLGYKIKEVPVVYLHDENSRLVPNFPVVVVAGVFIALIKLWFDCRRQYKKGVFKTPPHRFSFL